MNALLNNVGIGSNNFLHGHMQVFANNSQINNQFKEVGDHTWKLLPDEEKWHNVVGFGSASIPSYDSLAKNVPLRTLTSFCLTWNINEKPCRILNNIAEFFRNKEEIEDVVAIAIQEIPASSRLFHEEALGIIALSISQSHEIYFSLRAWSQMILIFIRKTHFRYAIKTPSSRFVPSAPLAKPVRTKGSIGVCFRLYQRMFVIVASHFSHGSIRQRLQDYHKMIRCLRFPTIRTYTGMDDLIFAADVVLWMGDLNFRLEPRSIEYLPSLAARMETIDTTDIMKYDELTQNRERGIVFVGFREGVIKFAPTYKLFIKKDVYERHRTPSYTDRVLYWSKVAEHTEFTKYESINELTDSDHRPVYCILKINVINRPIPPEFFDGSAGSSGS